LFGWRERVASRRLEVKTVTQSEKSLNMR